MKMGGLDLDDDQRCRRKWPEIIIRCVNSCIFAGLSQLALLVIPHFFHSFSLLSQLLLSGVVLVLAIGCGQCCRRLLGLRAWAPASVFFHIIFIWAVYLFLIRPAVSPLVDILLNGELAMLLFGILRISASDPGFVRHDSPAVSEDGAYAEDLPLATSGVCTSTDVTSFSSRRVRYCLSCKAYVRGFDHHCPAFGNCIGQKNYVLFMVLLVGLLATETSYAICSCQWLQRYHRPNESTSEIHLYANLVVSTMLFSLLQVLWQVLFLAWHICCACFNIKTDEWINWRNYPEFHDFCQLSPGQPKMRFRNPYNKGIFCNLKELWIQD